MICSLEAPRLVSYVGRQLDQYFPDGDSHDLERVVRRALERTEHCFGPVRLQPYRDGDRPRFDHLHSDQYATFLYLASNEAHRQGNPRLASKLYCLNKALNGLMCTYDTELPEHFLLFHTVGMMLGKASYGDYFVAFHHCTVGTDRGTPPRFGRGTVLYGGSGVVGRCEVGDWVSVGAQSLVRNADVPSDHVVGGISPALVIKPARRRIAAEYFDLPGS